MMIIKNQETQHNRPAASGQPRNPFIEKEGTRVGPLKPQAVGVCSLGLLRLRNVSSGSETLALCARAAPVWPCTLCQVHQPANPLD